MFTRKNISPARLALGCSLLVALPAALLTFFLEGGYIAPLSMFSLVLLVSYFAFFFTLEQFIHRKIKLIYKLISQTKATKREEFYTNELLPPKTLEEVNDDVEHWAEERKVELERLESNEQFRKEFLMNLAHELKTPIFTTQGYIHTLLDGALHDDKVNEQFLRNASRSIDRLADLVNDLDEISRLESNRIPIIKTEFVIQDLIRDVYEEFSNKAEQKGITLTIKKGCEKPVEVVADKQKIRQVLVNLVENSIKYGKENGTTSAGIYEVDKRTVLAEISDDGAGIAEHHIPRVFERFYRTDTARSRSVGGTGLGLAIVKHIIEAHNHSVHCRSTPDVGSSFGFTMDKKMR